MQKARTGNGSGFLLSACLGTRTNGSSRAVFDLQLSLRRGCEGAGKADLRTDLGGRRGALTARVGGP